MNINKTPAESLKDIKYGIAGERVFYVESTGNQTFVEDDDLNFQTATEWPSKFEPTNFDIENTGASPLTIELNDDGIVMTVDALKALGNVAVSPKIYKVAITALDSFTLMIRK